MDPLANPRTRCYAISIFVLIVGLSSALLINLTADDSPDTSGAYQVVIVDGVVYPVSPGDSKMYVREVERFGGKAAVLFDEINRWFFSLWRGKTLASTVAWITLALSLGLFLFARYLLFEPDSDE